MRRLELTDDGTKVAIVRADNSVRLQSVVVDGDFGTNVCIASALNSDDRVVVNPGDSLAQVSLVQVNP